MVKVKIGTMVLCHLLSGTPQNEGEAPKITKILGSIQEINVGKVPKIYEDPVKRIAYRVMGDELLVKTTQGALYQIDVNACMAIKESTDEEVDQVFKKEVPKAESVVVPEEKKEEAIEKQNMPSVENTTSAISDQIHKTLIAPPPPEIKAPEKKKEVKVEVKEVEVLPPPPPPVIKEEAPTDPKEDLKKESPPKQEKEKGLFDYLSE